MPTAPLYRDLTFTARDGLTLYARHYRARGAEAAAHRRPVLCLAGLTRNARDFHDLASGLYTMPGAARDVFALDCRGRGLSQFDPEWRNYAVPIEMLDVADFITAFGLHGCGIVGTSRGGLIAMVLAAAHPTAFGPIVLNDIGPVIDQAGLARISAYAGRIPLPGSWAEATKLMRDMNERAFPGLNDEAWAAIARQLFNERDGRPAPGYDPKIANSLSVLDGPMPALWPQYEALKIHPLLVIRGQNSDILSAATVEEMRRRHPMFSDYVVKDQGHAPLLAEKTTIAAISNFFAVNEQKVAQSVRATA